MTQKDFNNLHGSLQEILLLGLRKMHVRTMTVIVRKPNGERAKLELLYKPGTSGYIIKKVFTEDGKRNLRN